MTTGRSYHGARRVNAGAWKKALVDCLLQREGGTANVPDRGEPAHQRVLGLRGGGQKDVADIRGHHRLDR